MSENFELASPRYGRVYNQLLLDFARGRYSEYDRHYHNYNHICEMISIGKTLFNIDEIQYHAIIFHDIVYDGMSSYNEEDSVTEMRRWFKHFKGRMLIPFSDYEIDTIHTIIMDTKKHFYPTIDKSKEVLDLDLMRLAGRLIDVDKNSGDIRNEFLHVADDQFEIGRRKFFESLKDVPHIFQTFIGRSRWEPVVRKNVESILARG